MVRIEQIAKAALNEDSLQVRSLVQDFLGALPHLADIAQPAVTDQRLLATAASFLELFADRLNQPAPSWTAQIGPVPEPIYLLKAAATMKRLRHLCETESPAPLRKRNLYAPPNYLDFV